MTDPHRAASSPMAEETRPAPDPQEAREVAEWRKAERARLLEARRTMTVAEHDDLAKALATHLRHLLTQRFEGGRAHVLSAYWPMKGEPDLRPLMTELHEEGVMIALPVVEIRAAPLVFRRWSPEMQMVRGDWNIMVPPSEAEPVTPDITLAPLVGWDDAGYRLGYGGGYFDRTLASLTRRPFTIGIGTSSARLDTIRPQPHDIGMDVILTERGMEWTRA